MERKTAKKVLGATVLGLLLISVAGCYYPYRQYYGYDRRYDGYRHYHRDYRNWDYDHRNRD